LLSAKQQVHLCIHCFAFTDMEICSICSDTKRSDDVLCVVEKPSDVSSIDQTTEFRGKYHVLHGVLSPLDGVGPNEIKVKELLNRLRSHSVTEVIVATNPNVEGEATAIYLGKLIRPLGIKV